MAVFGLRQITRGDLSKVNVWILSLETLLKSTTGSIAMYNSTLLYSFHGILSTGGSLNLDSGVQPGVVPSGKASAEREKRESVLKL